MQKWEYTVLVTSQSLVQELNALGQEGWEVFGLDEECYDSEHNLTQHKILAKRPIATEQPPG